MRQPCFAISSFFLIALLISPAPGIGQLDNKRPSNIFSMQTRKVLDIGRKNAGSLAFSPNGSKLAVGAEGGDAQIWNIETGQLLHTLPGHRTVSRLDYSPNGQILATVSVGAVRLWDGVKGSLKAVLTEEKGIASSVGFSPDSQMIATASFESSEFRLWDVNTVPPKANFVHPKPYEYAHGVVGIVFTPDGKTLATASSRKLYLWDLATEQIRTTLTDDLVVFWEGFKPRKGFSHDDTIYQLVISPDGKMLATGSRDGTAKIWDVTKGELKTILRGHKRGIHRLAFSPDGRTLVTGSNDKTAKLWDTTTGRLLADLKHRGTVWSVAFSPDGKFVATASDNEKKVNLWDAATGRLVAELSDGRNPVAFSPDGRTLATASRNKTVMLWDVPVR